MSGWTAPAGAGGGGGDERLDGSRRARGEGVVREVDRAGQRDHRGERHEEGHPTEPPHRTDATCWLAWNIAGYAAGEPVGYVIVVAVSLLVGAAVYSVTLRRGREADPTFRVR